MKLHQSKIWVWNWFLHPVIKGQIFENLFWRSVKYTSFINLVFNAGLILILYLPVDMGTFYSKVHLAWLSWYSLSVMANFNYFTTARARLEEHHQDDMFLIYHLGRMIIFFPLWGLNYIVLCFIVKNCARKLPYINMGDPTVFFFEPKEDLFENKIEPNQNNSFEDWYNNQN